MAAIVPPQTILSHWYKLIEGLQTSPLEFYGAVEEALKRREAPNASPSPINWREGGLFSARRQYLRVARANLCFDICAAPFGSGFFVSWWLGRPRPSAVLPTLAFIFLFYLAWTIAREPVGFFMPYVFAYFGPYGFMATRLVATLLFVAFAFCAFGAFVPESPLDAYIIAIPIVGWLFERTFRPLTYYRIDTALMFQSTVHAAVLEVVDDFTKAKGLRSLTELERKPVLREFYK